MSDTQPLAYAGAPIETAGASPTQPRSAAVFRIVNRLQRLHPTGYHDFGLRAASSDRLLPVLAAAMTFLAALALAGFIGASALGRHWQQGAEATLTVQVPQPAALASPVFEAGAQANLPATSRVDRAMAVLRATPGIASAKLLTDDELAGLLRPWLGTAVVGIVLPMPAVIDVRLGEAAPEMSSLAARLDAVAPGTLVESHGTWVRRLSLLARSLQLCTAAALLVVMLLGAAMVAVATQAGLAVRREAIEIVHGLGATDSYIARPFAWRAMAMAGAGGAVGAIIALPALLWLADVVAPFSAASPSAAAGSARPEFALIAALPASLWIGGLLLPPAAAVIGWVTAHAVVRRWLRRLP